MELPGGPWTLGEVAEVGPETAPYSARWTRLPGFVEHVFTHFTLRLAIFSAPAPRRAPDGFVFIAPEAVEDAGFSGLMRKVAAYAAA